MRNNLFDVKIINHGIEHQDQSSIDAIIRNLISWLATSYKISIITITITASIIIVKATASDAIPMRKTRKFKNMRKHLQNKTIFAGNQEKITKQKIFTKHNEKQKNRNNQKKKCLI